MRKILLLLFILIVLFTSSGQTYEQQSLIPTLEKWMPGKPFESFLSIFQIPYWGIKVSIEERGYYYFVEFLLRKSAHFFIFGFLAITIYSVLPKHMYRLYMAAFITLFIAIADEFHQSLTGGRTPSFQDVILDMAGAITALLCTYFVLQKSTSKKRKNPLRGAQWIFYLIHIFSLA